MNQGDSIQIKATVLRVEGERLDAQTPNGQLIQTHVSNVVGYKSVKVEHKTVLNAPENKQTRKNEK